MADHGPACVFRLSGVTPSMVLHIAQGDGSGYPPGKEE